MKILRLRFAAIIPMARSLNAIATPVLFLFCCGRDSYRLEHVLDVDIVSSGNRIEGPAAGDCRHNRRVLGGESINTHRIDVGDGTIPYLR